VNHNHLKGKKKIINENKNVYEERKKTLQSLITTEEKIKAENEQVVKEQQTIVDAQNTKISNLKELNDDLIARARENAEKLLESVKSIESDKAKQMSTMGTNSTAHAMLLSEKILNMSKSVQEHFIALGSVANFARQLKDKFVVTNSQLKIAGEVSVDITYETLANEEVVRWVKEAWEDVKLAETVKNSGIGGQTLLSIVKDQTKLIKVCEHWGITDIVKQMVFGDYWKEKAETKTAEKRKQVAQILLYDLEGTVKLIVTDEQKKAIEQKHKSVAKKVEGIEKQQEKRAIVADKEKEKEAAKLEKEKEKLEKEKEKQEKEKEKQEKEAEKVKEKQEKLAEKERLRAEKEKEKAEGK